MLCVYDVFVVNFLCQISNLIEVCQKVERRMTRTQYLMAAILFVVAALLVCMLVSRVT